MNRSARFRISDWLDLGLDQLRAEGPAGLTVERLCDAAGRTRGSFYHHFEDHNAFIRSLMAHWQKLQTDDVIAKVEAVGDATRRPQELSLIASGLDHRLDVAMRRLGSANAVAAEYVNRVDDMRVAYLVKLYMEAAGVAESRALDLARLEYAAFVGSQVLWPEAGRDELSKMDAVFQSLVQAALGTA